MSTTKPSIQELSADTSLLAARLRKCEVGQTVNYEALTNTISRDVRGVARSNLTAAVRIVQRDYKMVFACIRGVGLKRLDDHGIVKTADSSITKIHRTAKRGRDKLLCVENLDGMSNESKTRYNASLAAFGALHEVTKAKAMERLEQAVENSKEKLPLKSTLEAFLGK